MDLKKAAQNHQNIKIRNVNKWLKEFPVFPEKGKFVLSKVNNEETLRWYCQDCALMLTSELQAQEHFVGKRHQNAVKNNFMYNNFNSKVKLAGNGSLGKNSLCYNFQNSKYCGKFYLHDCLRSKSELNDISEIIPTPAGRDNILETVIKSEKKIYSSSDLSIYRTPSGKYYCQSCNLTVNSQIQFLQHIKSRKHKQKSGRSFKIK